MNNNRNNSKITKTLIVCGVLLLSALSASWTLSERPLNNHECFVSITAREMIESGDWVWPTCNGESRLQKTPLSYWLVAGLAKITGKVDEFAARLPSAVFAVLSVAAILYFVNKWLSFRIAVISGCVWATSVGFISYAHSARPEMALTFFVLLCFLSFYSAITEKAKSKQAIYMFIFWASFALGNLAKGPAPLPLVLLPLFFYVSIFRQWKKLFNWTSVAGLIIFLVIVLPWPLVIAHRLNWDLSLWKREFVDRFLGDYAPGDKPFYYYLLQMFRFILPWAAFLPMAAAAPFFKVWTNKRPVMLFLWILFVVDLAFLTLSAGKRQHYILPIMPVMAVLIGILLEDMAFALRAYTQKYAKDVLRIHIIVVVAGAIAAVVYVIKTNPQLLAGTIVLGAAAIAAAAIIAVLFAKGKPAFACGVVFAGIVVLVSIAYTVFVNPLNYNEPSRQFTQVVVEKVPASDKLVAYKSASTRFIHYFGRRVPEITTVVETDRLYNEGYWVVAFGVYLDELLQKGQFEIVYTQKGAERHKGKAVDGALLHKSAIGG
ncbi:MAG: glycosyltransferase family 39 protein [Sedimentisphaerales bacterium]|nr:glycosyltransferase family 39 protein [Sedimentisphaerales bacterium]